jgi:NADH dehydrogenase [ubiquinone] 1 alpha subcomplex assembly factor 7
VTPLGSRIAALIRAEGPIGIDRFMALALGDPEHGYYRTRDPLGQAGDFITAPEISQVFGEICGLWLAEQWRKLGEPSPVQLVELGPGRGTLTADALRAMAVLPACRAAMRVHLVETSPALRTAQRETLARRHPDIVPAWHETLDTVPDGPMLLLANEFFDALPIRQWVRVEGEWRERLVGLDEDGALTFTHQSPLRPSGGRGSLEIFETCEPAQEVGRTIGGRLARHPGAALIIDYGHAVPACGDTLQAVRAHRYTPVLTDPGEADVTAHVDFAALAAAIREGGAATWGPATQGSFLQTNGALVRAEALARRAEPADAAAIRRGVTRLLDPAGMGRLFKILAATSPTLPLPSGF